MLSMEQRLPLLAIVRGLREAGEISDKSIAAIVANLEIAAGVPEGAGHHRTAEAFRYLATCIEEGRIE